MLRVRQRGRLHPARHAGMLQPARLPRPDLLREHPRRPLLARRPDRLRHRRGEHVEPADGDNEVTKNADTSDPGADCCYNGHPASECLGGTNLNDDPTLAAQGGCTPAGAGNDYKGKIVSTIGNGSPDANGIHYRLTTPELSTTWTDGQSPSGTCANGSTYDDGELLVSQLVLQAQPTTAGATGSFIDINGDGCRRAGQGFIAAANPATDGPTPVGPSP